MKCSGIHVIKEKVTMFMVGGTGEEIMGEIWRDAGKRPRDGTKKPNLRGLGSGGPAQGEERGHAADRF